VAVSVQDAIVDKLSTALLPVHLEVDNESHQHSVPAGSETHFKVIVVSAGFEGMSRVARHRRVHGLLAEELSGGVHALSVIAKTPGEWAASNDVPASPQCLGGSKAG
jgi:stress-induced morphogen